MVIEGAREGAEILLELPARQQLRWVNRYSLLVIGGAQPCCALSVISYRWSDIGRVRKGGVP